MSAEPTPIFRVSVILPTHNRSGSVFLTLDSLLDQSISADQYEIIIVDNASTDGSEILIKEWIDSEMVQNSGVSISYLRENQLGLHFARHAGAIAAQGEILAFTDDDAIVNPSWLQSLMDGYTTEIVGCVGGKIIPRWLDEPPDWIIPFAPGNLGALDLGEKVIALDVPMIFGGNMSIRRELLFQIGGFNPDSFGKKWLGDGETGLLRKVLATDNQVVYTPHAIVEHLIPAHRLTLEFMKLRRKNQAACDGYHYYREEKPGEWQLIKMIFRSTWWTIRHRVRSYRRRDYQDARYFDQELRSAYEWGMTTYNARLLLDRNFRKMVLRENWLNEMLTMPTTTKRDLI